MDTTIVLDIAWHRLALATDSSITLIAVHTITIFHILDMIEFANGIGTAEHCTTATDQDTHIGHIAFITLGALANVIIAIGIETAIQILQTFGSQGATETITFVATFALAFGTAQGLVVVAFRLGITYFRFLQGNWETN